MHIIYWSFTWIYICRNNYIFHNHIHHPFFKNKHLNRIFDLVMAFSTGMTSGNWRILHVHGHHIEHIIDKLPSRRYVADFYVERDGEYSLINAMKHSLNTSWRQFAIPLTLCLKYGLSNKGFTFPYYRYYLKEHLILFLIYGALIYVNPVVFLLYIFIPVFLIYIISRNVDFVTHINSRSSIANICLSIQYNATFWNFGYHVAHHLYPKEHWTKLPKLQEKLGVVPEESVSSESINIFGLLYPYSFKWHRAIQKVK